MPIYAQEEAVSIIVSYKTRNVNVQESVRENNLLSKIRIKHTYNEFEVIEFDNYYTAKKSVENLKKDNSVKYAEIDRQINLMGVSPNDTYFSNQWGNAYIGATTAWEAISFQQRQAVVAVIDTGVNANHPDLFGRVLQGYNAVNKGTNTDDLNGHGTRVSGVIAATTNNNTGIAGVTGMFDVAILPIKVMNDAGTIYLSSVLNGIYYAISKNVDVINISLGSEQMSYAELEAINEAKDADVTVVAAAGNNGNSTLCYPASYQSVISVASHTSSGSVSSFSNRNEYVDIIAPGSNIRTTSASGGYSDSDGTSFSSPYVAGIVAMIKAVRPNKTYLEITEILTSTAVKPSGQTGRSNTHGYGYANAAVALKQALNLDYSSSVIELNYDRVHLASGLSSVVLEATVSPQYNSSLAWYKDTDNSITSDVNSFELSIEEYYSENNINVKIPLNNSITTCQYSCKISSETTSVNNALVGVYVTHGTLLGDFDINKTSYYIHVSDINKMPVVMPLTSSDDVSYMMKYSKSLGEAAVLTIVDSSGLERHYTFTAIVLAEGLYPYTVGDIDRTTFAVATYKTSGNDYNLYMICAMYESSNNVLRKTVIVPVFFETGFNTYKTKMQVPDGHYVSVVFLKDFISIRPVSSELIYQYDNV